MSATRKESPLLRWGREKLVEVFGADLRSLAALRIVLASVVLVDLVNRAADLTAFYTDQGVMPRAALVQQVLNPRAFSLNLMSGEFLHQALLFGVTALAALALLVGYRTRLMTAIVWVLLLSIQWRNPLIVNGGDVLLRILLFWGLFLPLGAWWSVDRALKVAPPKLSMRFLSLATVGLFMQIAFMYWFTAIAKSGPEWRVDGTALYYAWGTDELASPVGAYLHQFPTLLEVLTFATLWFEAFGPFLLFCPFFTGPVRTAAALAFMGLHFGIWLTMDIGIFPWISALCMVCFFPAWFWDKAVPRLRGVLPGQSNIARHLRRAARPIRAQWSPLRARLSPVSGVGHPSVVGLAGYGDDRRGDGGTPTSTPPAPPSKQDEARPVTAEQGARRGGAGGPRPTMLRSSFVTNLLAACLLLYVFCLNLTTVSSFTMPSPPFSLGLEQTWNMFAPAPNREDGWYVIPGTLRGGQQVDLMAVTRDDYSPREGVSWEKPRYIPDTYQNDRWRKYLERIWEPGYTSQRLHLSRYICREWNARHTGSEQLTNLQLTYMLEITQPDYRQAAPRKVLMWEHSCF